MKASIESKVFLRLLRIESLSDIDIDIENQIPTVRGDCARDNYKWMSGQQGVAERLLTGAWDARSKPIRVRDDTGQDDVNGLGVGYHGGSQYVRHGVEGLESLMDSDL